jgi:hypothetical protein
MAKSFYSQEEVCQKLEMTAAELKIAVRDGKLREFRDGGKVTYKVDEVDRLAAAEEAVAGDELTAGSLSGSLADLDNLSTAELTLDDTSSDSKDDSLELRFADDDDDGTKAGTDVGGAGLGGTDTGTAGGSIGDSISLALEDTAGGPGGSTGGTGELVLEPDAKDDSGIQLGSDSDAVSLDDTATAGEEDEKEGTVVSSIGISVFDDDEIEQDADPLAQTVVSDGSEALGIDAAGSGSGLLDLTRESDDTSLGAELLDEIYPGDDSSEMGESTRAGLAGEIPEQEKAASDDFTATMDSPEAAGAAAVATAAAPRTTTRVEYGPDAMSSGLTGMMFVGVLVMCLAGLTAAAALQGGVAGAAGYGF